MATVLLLRPHTVTAAEAPALDAAFAALATYEYGPARTALAPIDLALIASHGNASARAALEGRLLAVLDSDATVAGKAYVCRQLARIGTERAVPSLARLLAEPSLAHPARAALESIPGPASLAALRDALASLDGAPRAGVVRSLGRRGDRQSVPQFTSLLSDDDARIRRAAVEALSEIDDPAACRAVLDCVPRATGEVRPAALHACLKVADRARRQGQGALAAAACERLQSAPEPWIRPAVLRGRVLAEPDQAVPMILQALAAEDPLLPRLAVQLAGRISEPTKIRDLAGAIPDLNRDGQILLLAALSARRADAVREAALQALNTRDDPALRQAALGALARSGQAADVPVLLAAAVAGPPEVAAVAERSLQRLSAAGTGAALLRQLDMADPAARQVVIRTVAARRQAEAVPQLLTAARAADAGVRLEALRALVSLARPPVAGALVDLLQRSPAGAERDAAERAVARCCLQIEPAARQAEPLLTAWRQARPAARLALLPALGRVGGPQALELMRTTLDSDDPALRSAAVRGLANWPDATVADELLELARNDPSRSHRVWALRGFARVVARQGRAQPQATFEQLHEAMQLAERDADRRLVLSRLSATRVPAALELAVRSLADAVLRDEAIEVTLSLAEGMKESHPPQARAALEQLQKITQNPDLQLKIAKLLWNMQLKGN